MQLKEFIDQKRITILDLSKATGMKFDRLRSICYNQISPTDKEKNKILQALCRFKVNPMSMVFYDIPKQ